jgi:vacuolar-type H+-ATPase subunit I/STV1
MPFTEFQFPHFVQYILLFGLGTIAHKMKWLDTIDQKIGKKWFIIVNMFIFLGFPILFILGGAHINGPDAFMGGFNWKCFSYAIWEQIVGLGMIVALFGIFKGTFNSQGSIAKKLSASAYAVYVFHTPIIVELAFVFLDFNIPQFWKFVVLSPIALVSCFLFAYISKQIPVVKDIL